MAINKINQDRELLKEAAAGGLVLIRDASDLASKTLSQTAADAAKLLTSTAADAAKLLTSAAADSVRALASSAADAAKVVSNAAAVNASIVDKKTGDDREAIIRIEMDVKSIIVSLNKVEDGGIVRDQRMLKLEESKASTNILISIGTGMLVLETGLLLWSLFKVHA